MCGLLAAAQGTSITFCLLPFKIHLISHHNSFHSKSIFSHASGKVVYLTRQPPEMWQEKKNESRNQNDQISIALIKAITGQLNHCALHYLCRK